MFDRFTTSTFSNWKAKLFALLIDFSPGFLKIANVAIETIFCLRTTVPGSAADNYKGNSWNIIKKNNHQGTCEIQWDHIDYGGSRSTVIAMATLIKFHCFLPSLFTGCDSES